MSICQEKYRVGIQNVGSSNLITNRGYLSLLEDIACRHSDLVGYGINDIEEKGVSWVLLDWKVKIIKRVKYGSILTLKTWGQFNNKFFATRDFEVIDEDGNVVCIATTKWTLIDIKTESITTITDTMINMYGSVNERVFGEEKLQKLKEPTNFSNTYEYTVQRRDIDINKHMHNLYYLDLAYEILPKEIYEKKEFNNFHIMYKTGAKLGDKLKCYYSEQESDHYITIKSEDGKKLHAIVKLK